MGILNSDTLNPTADRSVEASQGKVTSKSGPSKGPPLPPASLKTKRTRPLPTHGVFFASDDDSTLSLDEGDSFQTLSQEDLSASPLPMSKPNVLPDAPSEIPPEISPVTEAEVAPVAQPEPVEPAPITNNTDNPVERPSTPPSRPRPASPPSVPRYSVARLPPRSRLLRGERPAFVPDTPGNPFDETSIAGAPRPPRPGRGPSSSELVYVYRGHRLTTRTGIFLDALQPPEEGDPPGMAPRQFRPRTLFPAARPTLSAASTVDSGIASSSTDAQSGIFSRIHPALDVPPSSPPPPPPPSFPPSSFLQRGQTPPNGEDSDADTLSVGPPSGIRGPWDEDEIASSSPHPLPVHSDPLYDSIIPSMGLFDRGSLVGGEKRDPSSPGEAKGGEGVPSDAGSAKEEPIEEAPLEEGGDIANGKRPRSPLPHHGAAAALPHSPRNGADRKRGKAGDRPVPSSPLPPITLHPSSDHPSPPRNLPRRKATRTRSSLPTPISHEHDTLGSLSHSHPKDDHKTNDTWVDEASLVEKGSERRRSLRIQGRSIPSLSPFS